MNQPALTLTRGRALIERIGRASGRSVAAVLVIMLGALAAACGRTEPELELRATIASMARAIEQHRVGEALEPLADDFTRDSGAFGKPEARRVLAGAMLRNETIRLNATVTDVRIEGTRASAKIRVMATGGSGLLPERGQTWEFDTTWRRERGGWKVFNAEWREGL